MAAIELLRFFSMIEIRRASPADAKVLTELGKSTFLETYSKDNKKEDMDMYLSQTFAVDKQLNEINDPNSFIEMAWVNGQAVGYLHLKTSRPDSSVTGARPIEIFRLYVDSRWQGKGVGPGLMDKCIRLASEKGFQTLWLGVWERNFKAQSFYKKYDFRIQGHHIFQLGNDEQTDLIMSRPV